MWIEDIENYKPRTIQEEKDKEQILKAYDLFHDSLLNRENTFMHFTSSSLILNETHDKVLMVYHNIYDSFCWTGGHNDGDSDFLRVAKKEAMEETNIHEPKLLQEGFASIEILPVRPHFKRNQYVSPHLHLNVSYLFESSESENIHIKEDENSNVKWLEISQLDQYISLKDAEMLPIYKKILNL